jgi:Ca2+-binding EF-hand superfamily protein
MKHLDKSIAAVRGNGLLGLVIANLLVCAAVSGPVRAAEATAPAKATQAATPLFDMLDANKDQVLSRQEFQSGYAGLQRLIAAQLRLREQFGVLDANRNGAIDASEFANLELIRHLGTAAPSLIAFDIDHDQKLSFSEYATLVRRLSTGQASVKK